MISLTGMNTHSPLQIGVFLDGNCRKWTKLLDALSDEKAVSESYEVATKNELDRLVSKPDFGKGITLVEVVVPMFDAPPALRRYQ